VGKLADRIREGFEPSLERGEELRSVGQVSSGPMSAVPAMLLMALTAYVLFLVLFGFSDVAIVFAAPFSVFVGLMGHRLFVKYWYVGITQRRAIFVRLTASSKPDENTRFATPLKNVALSDKGLTVISPVGDTPQGFRFYFGARRATGLDVDEFKEALTTGSGAEDAPPRGARVSGAEETRSGRSATGSSADQEPVKLPGALKPLLAAADEAYAAWLDGSDDFFREAQLSDAQDRIASALIAFVDGATAAGMSHADVAQTLRNRFQRISGESFFEDILADGGPAVGPMAGEAEATTKVTTAPVAARLKAKTDEHYVLNCVECGFSHSIPSDRVDGALDWSVDVDEVKMTCLYGGVFTVSLGVKDFFGITTAPASGQVLHASIGENMKALHGHMLSHCDPLFLSIRQSPNQTRHEYKRGPVDEPYVRFSKDSGIDVVGSIDVSKAEIPGVSG